MHTALASVMIPGAVINTVVRASRIAVTRATILPILTKKLAKTTSISSQHFAQSSSIATFIAKWFPTMTGLGSIPFIVHPIDSFVDILLDNSTRKYMYTVD